MKKTHVNLELYLEISLLVVGRAERFWSCLFEHRAQGFGSQASFSLWRSRRGRGPGARGIAVSS